MKKMTLEKIGCALQRLDSEQWRLTQCLTEGKLRNAALYPLKKKRWEMQFQRLLEELMVEVRRRGWEHLIVHCLRDEFETAAAAFYNSRRKRRDRLHRHVSSGRQDTVKKGSGFVLIPSGGMES